MTEQEWFEAVATAWFANNQDELARLVSVVDAVSA